MTGPVNSSPEFAALTDLFNNQQGQTVTEHAHWTDTPPDVRTFVSDRKNTADRYVRPVMNSAPRPLDLTPSPCRET